MLFGLAHGLVISLPVIAVVRLRARVDPRRAPTASSPACSCTRLFNLVALVAAVTIATARFHAAVRRVALVALAVLVFAPSAHAAPCGVTATPRASGRRRSTVTFTATCTSATYAWSFGDGEEGLGASVQHVYGAGALHPTLTTDAGAEAAPVVTAISLTVTGPKRRALRAVRDAARDASRRASP